MVSRKTAQVKLKQISQNSHKLCSASLEHLCKLKLIVQSSLSFTRIRSVETVPSTSQFVYCFKLAGEPPAFFIEGGVLTHNCFGYLGYKNARFGRIEAHEAVTAFGREKLLRAKELAEARGYRVLHALTDSLWLKRDEMNKEGVLALCKEITQETKIEMSLEGMYDWIVFLPSKVNDDRPVACRYYGVFSSGKIKLRGLACRRSDTPQFIKEVQWEMLEIVSKARTLAERTGLTGQIQAVLDKRSEELRRGEVDPQKLVLKRTLTKEIDDYRVATRTAVAARQLRDAGVKVHPGERVGYTITDARARKRSSRVRAEEVAPGSDYDVDEYIKMLHLAAAEVLAYIKGRPGS
jgi:DNA polymerase-2